MSYLGRRIGKSQDTATDTGDGAGGGLLDLFTNGYFQRQGNIYNAPGIAPGGLTATGGVISDYIDGSDVYRAHIFTSSGAFNVTALGTLGDTVDYLVVAGGGGASSGGAGAGGYRTNVPTSIAPPLHNTSSLFPVSIGDYPVIIGGGGSGVPTGSAGAGNGVDSSFGPPAEPERIISKGGGASGYINVNSAQPGGSGGGGGRASVHESPGGATLTITGLPVSPTSQGFPGGANDSAANYNGGGGGGAGAAGGDASPGSSSTGVGGVGLRNAIAGPNYPIGTPGPGPTTGGWVAGGGGTGGDSGSSPAAPGGAGGGGDGGFAAAGTPGTYATGGGAGGGNTIGGNGGSGIVVVRYKIGQLTATAKATGGAISYYSGKTIHTFTSSGTFTAPGTFNETVEYVVVAGGGGGGSNHAGGGGAGGYRTGTTPISGPSATTIQVGAGGIGGVGSGAVGLVGTDSYFGAPLTATRGGGGASDPAVAQPGGSGGGGHRDGGAGTGNTPPTSPPQGNPGGTSSPTSGPIGGSGGGGAGSAGFANSGSNGGHGGTGAQLPSTFQDPKSTVGFPGPSGTYWVAGGGGGGSYDATGGSGGGPGGPYAGAGNGANAPAGTPGNSANQSSGSGGGGGATNNGSGGSGGSGIVLIAYPS